MAFRAGNNDLTFSSRHTDLLLTIRTVVDMMRFSLCHVTLKGRKFSSDSLRQLQIFLILRITLCIVSGKHPEIRIYDQYDPKDIQKAAPEKQGKNQADHGCPK